MALALIWSSKLKKRCNEMLMNISKVSKGFIFYAYLSITTVICIYVITNGL